MKVEFMPGIESITGSIKNKVTGKRIVFKHYRSDKPGHGRMYLRTQNDYVRATLPSSKEMKARERLAAISQQVAAMPANERAEYAARWKKAKGKLKGKKYNTLRGFIMACLYAEEIHEQHKTRV